MNSGRLAGRAATAASRFVRSTSSSTIPFISANDLPLTKPSRFGCVSGRSGSAARKTRANSKSCALAFLVPFVLPPARQQARDQALPKNVLALPRRMFDAQRRGIGPRAEEPGQLFVDERQRHRFEEPGRQQHVGQPLAELIVQRGLADFQGNQHLFGNLFVAVDPGDFFDQVDFARQIAAPRRGSERDGPGVMCRRLGQAQRLENPDDRLPWGCRSPGSAESATAAA